MPCRWLLLHNYTLSVPEVFTAINRPALKAISLAALASNSQTQYGSRENFINYITKSELAELQHWIPLIALDSLSGSLIMTCCRAAGQQLDTQPVVTHARCVNHSNCVVHARSLALT